MACPGMYRDSFSFCFFILTLSEVYFVIYDSHGIVYYEYVGILAAIVPAGTKDQTQEITGTSTTEQICEKFFPTVVL